jgi:hypothetical protein
MKIPTEELHLAHAASWLLENVCGLECLGSVLSFVLSPQLFYTSLFFLPFLVFCMVMGSIQDRSGKLNPVGFALFLTVLIALSFIHGGLSMLRCETNFSDFSGLDMFYMLAFYVPKAVLGNHPIWFAVSFLATMGLVSWLISRGSKIDVKRVVLLLPTFWLIVTIVVFVPYMLLFAGFYKLLFRTFC